MKIFKTISLLLSSFIFLTSCSPIKGYKKVEKTINPLNLHSVIDTTSKSSVYKANVSIYKKYFSGLFLIKYFPNDTAYHVVLLSEVGLNILDMEYKKNEMNVISCQDFINKKIILNTLKKDFLLLFQDFKNLEKTKTFENSTDSTVALKFHKKCNKSYYFCIKNNVKRIYRKGFLWGAVNVDINYNENQIFDKIDFKHKGIKLEMNLTRLK